MESNISDEVWEPLHLRRANGELLTDVSWRRWRSPMRSGNRGIRSARIWANFVKRASCFPNQWTGFARKNGNGKSLKSGFAIWKPS